MAIYFVTGKIGSGKTYYCVYSLLKKHFYYDDVLGEYISNRPVLFITNISKLQVDHIDLDKSISESGIEYVFSKTHIQKLREEFRVSRVIFIIDEVQKYFHRKFFSKDVFEFLQYSRHYGLDVYMITQDEGSVSKEVRELPEFIIRAASRSVSFGGIFHYKKIVNDEVTGRFVIRVDKKIFRFYKSYEMEEGDKPPRVLYKYAVILVVGLGLAVFTFKVFFINAFLKQGKTNKPSASAPVVPQKSDTFTPLSFSSPLSPAPAFASTTDGQFTNTNGTVLNRQGSKISVVDTLPLPDSYQRVSVDCMQSGIVKMQGLLYEYFDCPDGQHYYFKNRLLVRKSLVVVSRPVHNSNFPVPVHNVDMAHPLHTAKK